VDRAYDVGVAQGEQVVVAGQVAVVRREALAPIGRVVEATLLDHRAHRAVEHQDPGAEELAELLGRIGAVGPLRLRHGTPCRHLVVALSWRCRRVLSRPPA
jgi:hypothetical protein